MKATITRKSGMRKDIIKEVIHNVLKVEKDEFATTIYKTNNDFRVFRNENVIALIIE